MPAKMNSNIIIIDATTNRRQRLWSCREVLLIWFHVYIVNRISAFRLPIPSEYCVIIISLPNAGRIETQTERVGGYQRVAWPTIIISI